MIEPTRIMMLLRECQVVLRAHTEGLNLQVAAMPGGKFDFENRERVRTALKALSSIPSLGRGAATALQLAPFSVPSTVFPSEAHEGLLTHLGMLQQDCRLFLGFLDAMLPKEPEYYFTIKAPPEGKTLEDSAKFLKSLSFALGQLLAHLGLPALEVSTVEPGSNWHEILTTSPAVLGFVGGILNLARTASEIREKRTNAEAAVRKIDALKAEAETLRIQSEHDTRAAAEGAEAERLAAEMARQAARDSRALERQKKDLHLRTEELLDQFIDSPTPELVSTLEASIKEIADLYAEGTEWRLQLNAPAEIAEKFPPEARPAFYSIEPKKLSTAKEPKLLPPSTE